VRYLKLYLLAALIMTAFSITTVARATLPSILNLSGVTSNSIHALDLLAKTVFTGIVNITGEGYKFTLKDNFEMTSLGPALLTFTNVLFGTKKCKANGDTAGNVLVPGEWHTVLALSGGGAKLFLLLFLVTPSLVVECEGTNITITGDQLLDAVEFGKETEILETVTGTCVKNRPEFATYVDDQGPFENAGLKSETGGLKSASCLEVQGIQVFVLLMAEVMEP